MNQKIMVFIPMYNCEKQITRVLENFNTEIQQLFCEVVVIDNRSNDNSVDSARSALAIPLSVLSTCPSMNPTGLRSIKKLKTTPFFNLYFVNLRRFLFFRRIFLFCAFVNCELFLLLLRAGPFCLGVPGCPGSPLHFPRFSLRFPRFLAPPCSPWRGVGTAVLTSRGEGLTDSLKKL